MTNYEGIEYFCKKHWLSNYFDILPINYCDNYITSIYSTYRLKVIENKSGKETTCLLPTFYRVDKPKKIVSYVQNFIDYLYEKRSDLSLYNVSDGELKNILNDFLLIYKKDILERKLEIEKQKNIIELANEKRNFEQSCLIYRKLIYNVITYIVNHYEKDMFAIQEKEEKRCCSSEWITLYEVHKLKIRNGDYEVVLKNIIDEDGCYPDEVYCGLYVDLNKDTNICFFDVKNEISLITKNCSYLNKFMDMIEQQFYISNNVTREDIKEFLAILSNEKKGIVLIRK